MREQGTKKEQEAKEDKEANPANNIGHISLSNKMDG
jgi:hypothetical protein